MDRIEENVDAAVEHVQTGEKEITEVGKWAWQLHPLFILCYGEDVVPFPGLIKS